MVIKSTLKESRAAYIRFALVFIAIHFGVVAYLMFKADGGVVERASIGGIFFTLGASAIALFFYKGRGLIERYSATPGRHVFLELLFGKRKTLKGEKPDA